MGIYLTHPNKGEKKPMNFNTHLTHHKYKLLTGLLAPEVINLDNIPTIITSLLLARLHRTKSYQIDPYTKPVPNLLKIQGHRSRL